MMDKDRFHELETILAPKCKKFLEIFVMNGDGVEALRLAGYRPSKSLANNLAWKMLHEPLNIEYLELLKQYNKETNTVTALMIAEELKRVAFFDVSNLVNEQGKFKDKNSLKKYGKIIKKIKINNKQGTTEIEVYDKMDAIDKLAKWIGFYEKDNEQKVVEGVQFYLPDNGRADSSKE